MVGGEVAPSPFVVSVFVLGPCFFSLLSLCYGLAVDEKVVPVITFTAFSAFVGFLYLQFNFSVISVMKSAWMNTTLDLKINSFHCSIESLRVSSSHGI
ncbi:hypothetical protein V6N13_106840 [Hibiscus sabdariffa]|uniref:Uncharacterized protein n=1 Tax=Hibiscus sabdariffa TaxID=183260 RepID=A0ABR2F1Z2_9ROSI